MIAVLPLKITYFVANTDGHKMMCVTVCVALQRITVTCLSAVLAGKKCLLLAKLGQVEAVQVHGSVQCTVRTR